MVEGFVTRKRAEHTCGLGMALGYMFIMLLFCVIIDVTKCD